MSRRRWIVSYLGVDASQIFVFSVRAPDQQDWEAVQIWYSHGSVRCTDCSGPMAAMLASCDHANAVRRAIRAGRYPDVPPYPKPVPASRPPAPESDATLRELVRDYLAACDAVDAEARRAEQSGANAWSSAPVARMIELRKELRRAVQNPLLGGIDV